MLHKKTLLVTAVIITALVIFDLSYGKRNNPAYFDAPQPLCAQNLAAITVPPAGIFICPDDKADTAVKNHELVHWSQYQRFGTLSYYGNYIWGWIIAGFKYENNWMEQEAIQLTNGTAL